MSNNSTAVSSDDWCTPKWLAELLGHWDIDPCSNERSHIRATWAFTSRGLDVKWTGQVFCNPPYSDVQPWAERLCKHYEFGWCALVKLDPTTKWWSTLFSTKSHRATWWAPFRKRIKFERPDKPPLTANFPSALVWSGWWPSLELRKHLWSPIEAQEAWY